MLRQLLLIGALFADYLLGDPRVAWHPVVLIGNFIGAVRGQILKESDSPNRKKLNGLILLLITILTVYILVFYLIHIAYEYLGYWAVVLEIILVSFTITPNSLARDGREIYDLLRQNNLAEARRKVGWIVGRDTESLDAQEVTRATVETIAESITDGIVAPLFYAMLGGAPLAFCYRTINTLDSMVGYKNNQYLDFGMPSARFDDLSNYLPARITGILLIPASFLLKYDWRNCYRIMWRDAGKHPSPNSGWPEAAVAGALNIRLGGTNYYFGRSSFRAYMGDANKDLQPADIKAVIKLMYSTTLLTCGLFVLLLCL